MAQRPDDVYIGTDSSEWMTADQMVGSLGEDVIKAVVEDVTVHGGADDFAC